MPSDITQAIYVIDQLAQQKRDEYLNFGPIRTQDDVIKLLECKYQSQTLDAVMDIFYVLKDSDGNEVSKWRDNIKNGIYITGNKDFDYALSMLGLSNK